MTENVTTPLSDDARDWLARASLIAASFNSRVGSLHLAYAVDGMFPDRFENLNCVNTSFLLNRIRKFSGEFLYLTGVRKYSDEMRKILDSAGKAAIAQGRNSVHVYDIAYAMYTTDCTLMKLIVKAAASQDKVNLSNTTYWERTILRRIKDPEFYNAEKEIYGLPDDEPDEEEQTADAAEAPVPPEPSSDKGLPDDEQPAEPAPEPGFIPLCSIGDPEAGKNKIARYTILTKPMPVSGTYSPDILWEVLDNAFPWMTEASTLIAQSAAAIMKGHIKRFPYLLLTGNPGTGKTAWASEVAACCGLKSRVVSAAGSGHFITGFERTWSSSQPSLPARVIRDMKVPNPLVVMDEIDKTAVSSGSGIPEAMLPLLDDISSASYYDIFLQGELNTSLMSWIFTSNSNAGLPLPFLDRVTIIPVRRPTLKEVESAAVRILEKTDTTDNVKTDIFGRMMKEYAKGGTLRILSETRDRCLRELLWSPPPSKKKSVTFNKYDIKETEEIAAGDNVVSFHPSLNEK